MAHCNLKRYNANTYSFSFLFKYMEIKGINVLFKTAALQCTCASQFYN